MLSKSSFSYFLFNHVFEIFIILPRLFLDIFFYIDIFLSSYILYLIILIRTSVRKKPVQCNRKNNHCRGNQKGEGVVKNINERLLAFFFIRSLVYRGEKLVATFIPKEDKKKGGKHRTTRLIIAMERQWRAWLLCWP